MSGCIQTMHSFTITISRCQSMTEVIAVFWSLARIIGMDRLDASDIGGLDLVIRLILVLTIECSQAGFEASR